MVVVVDGAEVVFVDGAEVVVVVVVVVGRDEEADMNDRYFLPYLFFVLSSSSSKGGSLGWIFLSLSLSLFFGGGSLLLVLSLGVFVPSFLSHKRSSAVPGTSYNLFPRHRTLLSQTFFPNEFPTEITQSRIAGVAEFLCVYAGYVCVCKSACVAAGRQVKVGLWCGMVWSEVNRSVL